MKWKITMQWINNVPMYAVYKLINENEVQHSGNMEFATGYTADRMEAVRKADELNKEESKR